MALILTYVGLAGFLLSVFNLLLMLWQRRMVLRVNEAHYVIMKPLSFYLDIVVSNKSNLPISVISADWVYSPRSFSADWEYSPQSLYPADTTCDDTLENRRIVGNTVTKEKTIVISTHLPVMVGSFESRHIILRFPLETMPTEALKQINGGNSDPIKFRLKLHTSRRHGYFNCIAEPIDSEKWIDRLLNL